MIVDEIIKHVGRRTNQLSSDNKTFRDKKVTREGLLDELNLLYRDVICQHLMVKDPDLFAVVATQNLYRTFFTVSAVDTVNNTITAPSGVFGTADLTMQLYNSTQQKYVKITGYTSATQVTVTGEIDATWVGDTVYIMSNIIVLKGDISDMKDIRKVQLQYASANDFLYDADHTTVTNFKDEDDNYTVNTQYAPIYTVTSIEENGYTKEAIKISPRPTKPEGVITITYTQLPQKLGYEDTPRFSNFGISEVLINGLTAFVYPFSSILVTVYIGAY
jgi:hypothetical protein